MTCLLDPINCATGWLAVQPWGWFLAGMALGAILGRYLGAVVILAALLFVRFKPKKPVPSEDIWKHPDDKPRIKRRPF